MKTLAFIDFDGVFNAIPYESVWIGSDERTSHGFELLNPSNWETRDVPIDTETHFELDRQEIVKFNNGYKDKEFLINFSSELVEAFKELMANELIDFYWASTWREEAVRSINPLFGFDDNKTKVLKWQDTSLSLTNPEIGKPFGINDLLSKMKKLDSSARDRKLLWIDDVATMGHIDLSQQELDLRRNSKHPDEILLQDNLIIRPDTKFGISREELKNIIEFVS